MTGNFPVNYGVLDEMHRLVAASLAGNMSPGEAARFEELVGQDLDACDLYLNLISESSILLAWAIHGGLKSEEPKKVRADHLESDQRSETPIPMANSPTLPLLTPSLPNTASFLSSGWPVAYLIATVICGVSMLVGSLTPVSQPVQVARRSSVPGRAVAAPKTELVGRITGMVDCKWAGVASDSPVVPLGRKYELASGLVEITYDTGAKVILQGPVTYEVESATGGYLSIGKLTGKVEKKAAKGFCVRTPTAIVTDLGTEFGVEVSKEGHTTSHVFRGVVRVEVVAVDGKAQGSGQVLRENESVQVDGNRGQRKIVVVPGATSAGFIREMPKREIKMLDLVDVVAGGDGFSGRRNRGLDPTTGRVTDTLPKEPRLIDDGKYHRVEGLPFIDGVFVPDGRTGNVQIDSAGHRFDAFPVTAYETTDYIRPAQVVHLTPELKSIGATPTELGGIDYALPGHRGLLLHANKGITFDLQAIRRANPGWRLARFRAVAGNTEAASAKGEPVYADVWVFVDGQSRFQRRQINRFNGAMPVNVPIGPQDHFLTLVATDGGNGILWDWIMFGDPRLELLGVGGREVQREAARE